MNEQILFTNAAAPAERESSPPKPAPPACSEVRVALSIRQPWAWLIVNGYKDIENRKWETRFRGRFLVHASKGMTRREYIEAKEFMLQTGRKIPLPDFEQFELGGIVGDVELAATILVSETSQIISREVAGVTREDRILWQNSPWLCGPFGFCLRCARVLPFRACKGSLGFFKPQNEKGQP